MITLGSNISSLRATRQIGVQSDALRKTAQRLSSGLRINRASDDSAGLAISSQLSAESRILLQAKRNINDGISTISIAEGALQSMLDITIRIKELAAQSANGTLKSSQRVPLHAEANQLVSEYNRLAQVTKFNNITLLDPNTSIQLQIDSASTSQLTVSFSESLRHLVGDRTFSPLSASGSATVATTIGDFNGDGIDDKVSADTFFLGNANGTFKFGGVLVHSQIAVSSGTADIDGDGYLDIALNTYQGGGSAPDTICVYFGRGDGTFTSGQEYNLGITSATFGAQIGFGDNNGDGILDVFSEDIDAYLGFTGVIQ